MELKDLSSNWKKLQLALKQKNVISDTKSTDEGRERPHGLKRKLSGKGSLNPQHIQYPRTKRRKPSARMEATYSEQEAAAPTKAPPTIRSIAQSIKTSFAADRVNEGLSQTYVAIEYSLFAFAAY
jgi:hypothetical protein